MLRLVSWSDAKNNLTFNVASTPKQAIADDRTPYYIVDKQEDMICLAQSFQTFRTPRLVDGKT
jgi:hypothetical protein